ncbi:hypothetical protein Golob_026455 [Gossypium lobatum]|uniref:Uncharacterized protein n=1 Tax=Gossypium lobatum TaxID=34289 RepID=A0A7J8LV66_9ROSI|nr:hypothetical protein [Gossypium lobatum]
MEYDSKNVGRGICAYLCIRVRLDVRRSLKRKKKGSKQGLWDGEGKKESITRIDPMLGLNLKGDLKLELDMKGDASKIQGQSDMEHNSEECAIVGGDGKKRPRRDSGNCSKGNAPRSLNVGGVPRDERRMEAFRETLKEC